MTAPSFSAAEALRYGFSKYQSEAGHCLRFLFAIEAVVLISAVTAALNTTALAQLITQLDSPPPDTFWYVFAGAYLIFRCLAQVLVNKWLLLLADGRIISRDEILGFDFGYHFGSMLKMLAASIIFSVYAVLGSFFLVIPGLYALSTLRFYKFLIVDRDADAVEGLRESYELCGDSKGQLIGLSLMSIVLRLGGVLCLGIGLIPMNAVCGLAEAYAYKKLVENYEQSQGYALSHNSV